MLNKKVVSLALLVVFLIGSTLSAQAAPSDHAKPVCPGPAATGDAHCHAWVHPNVSSSPYGLSPATIKAVYGFSTSASAGAGKTIAIVDAYDDPTAESDL